MSGPSKTRTDLFSNLSPIGTTGRGGGRGRGKSSAPLPSSLPAVPLHPPRAAESAVEDVLRAPNIASGPPKTPEVQAGLPGDTSSPSGEGKVPRGEAAYTNMISLLEGIHGELRSVGDRLDVIEDGARERAPFPVPVARGPDAPRPERAGRSGGFGEAGGLDDSALLEADGVMDAERRGESEGSTGDDARTIADAEALGEALGWHRGNAGAAFLIRFLRGDAPVPAAAEAVVRDRNELLRVSARQPWRGLQRAFRVDARTLALASLFVDPIGTLDDQGLLEDLFEDVGVALAFLYAEHAATQRAVSDGADVSEREVLAVASAHARAPPTSWCQKPKDSSLDLAVCWQSGAQLGKVPKGFIDSQRLLRAIAAGADVVLEEVAGLAPEDATWLLVKQVHKIGALAAACAVANAEGLLAPVIAAAPSEYKAEQRIKVEKALTARERADADQKAAVKAQADATAANEKIAQVLSARGTAPKWQGAEQKAARSAGAQGGAQSGAHAGAQKRQQKRAAAASFKESSNATTAAKRSVEKSVKSPEHEKIEGDDDQ